MFRVPFLVFLFFSAVLADTLPPEYVWNLGMAMMCDKTPFKSGLMQDYHPWTSHHYIDFSHYITDLKDGDIVWVPSSKLSTFVHTVLPTLPVPIILCINEGDESFPSSFRREFDVDLLFTNPQVIHIFVQNMDISAPRSKVTPIPIGIDYHTIAHSKHSQIFMEKQQSVEEQEEALNALLSSLQPTEERIPKAFIDFQLNDRGKGFGESRSAIFKKISKSHVVDVARKQMPRYKLWEIKGKYAFSISPHGVGLDCHRTWEDLLLGCIVIVKTSSLDPLYEGLPVVIIKDWSEVDKKNFEKWLRQYKGAFTNPEFRVRLTSAYWMSRVRYKQEEYKKVKARLL